MELLLGKKVEGSRYDSRFLYFMARTKTPQFEQVIRQIPKEKLGFLANQIDEYGESALTTKIYQKNQDLLKKVLSEPAK